MTVKVPMRDSILMTASCALIGGIGAKDRTDEPCTANAREQY